MSREGGDDGSSSSSSSSSSNPSPKFNPVNDCPQCIKERKAKKLFLKYPSHDPDKCCLNCRNFVEIDQHASRSLKLTDLWAQLKQGKGLLAGLQPDYYAVFIANELTQNFESPTVKARILYVWIASNLMYDFDQDKQYKLEVEEFLTKYKEWMEAKQKAGDDDDDLPDEPKTPEARIIPSDEILQKGMGQCFDMARIFAEMCQGAGLTCSIVSGCCKTTGWLPQVVDWDPKAEPNVIRAISKSRLIDSGHAWNMVELDDKKKHLIDVTWGLGYLREASDGSSSYKPFSIAYFNLEPMEFVLTHFPVWHDSNPDQMSRDLFDGQTTPDRIPIALKRWTGWYPEPDMTSFTHATRQWINWQISIVGTSGKPPVGNTISIAAAKSNDDGNGKIFFYIQMGCSHIARVQDFHLFLKLFKDEHDETGTMTKLKWLADEDGEYKNRVGDKDERLLDLMSVLQDKSPFTDSNSKPRPFRLYCAKTPSPTTQSEYFPLAQFWVGP